jgi:hypothetical protein
MSSPNLNAVSHRFKAALPHSKPSLGELPVSELEGVEPIEDFKRFYAETKSMASVMGVPRAARSRHRAHSGVIPSALPLARIIDDNGLALIPGTRLGSYEIVAARWV